MVRWPPMGPWGTSMKHRSGPSLGVLQGTLLQAGSFHPTPSWDIRRDQSPKPRAGLSGYNGPWRAHVAPTSSDLTPASCLHSAHPAGPSVASVGESGPPSALNNMISFHSRHCPPLEYLPCAERCPGCPTSSSVTTPTSSEFTEIAELERQ